MLQKSDVNKILKMRKKRKTVADIACDTGHSKTTVIKYLKNPAIRPMKRGWVTRHNPFEKIKHEIEELFLVNPTLEATSLLDYFMEKYPDRFHSGQLRTLQRYLKVLRAEIGPAKEIIFPQEHRPGELSASDFTNMNDLGVTIGGGKFDHLLYHFVLTYSNWEWGRICFSESLESLRAGLKECLFRLGGVSKEHLTDNLTAAVHNIHNPGTFKDRYQEILSAFGMMGRTIQPGCPHENGDIEQRHYRLKKAVDQGLMLRGSRNFATKGEYETFLHRLFYKLNGTRHDKVEEETAALLPLPTVMIADYTIERAKVSSCSTIRVRSCLYSVPSRLIGEEVEVRVYDNRIEVWYAQKHVFTTERLRGEHKHRIDYRHLIEGLKRKPGALNNYRYRESLYPTTLFKFAYENFVRTDSLHAAKNYIELLEMAALNGQDRVEKALAHLFKEEEALQLNQIKELVEHNDAPDIRDVHVELPDLKSYDIAFGLGGAVC
jgi:transposase InsO family protein